MDVHTRWKTPAKSNPTYVANPPSLFLEKGQGGEVKKIKIRCSIFKSITEKDQQKSIQKGVELLSTPGILEAWQIRRQKMLTDKIDVTAFLHWFVENWPESMKIMIENPGYSNRFNPGNTPLNT